MLFSQTVLCFLTEIKQENCKRKKKKKMIKKICECNYNFTEKIYDNIN